MDKPVIASRFPYPLPVKKGEKVFWCACGRSENQPYCDGSHKGTGITPVPYTAPRDKIVFFCHHPGGLHRPTGQDRVLLRLQAQRQGTSLRWQPFEDSK